MPETINWSVTSEAVLEHEADVTFSVDAGATDVALNGPVVLVGPGPVSLLQAGRSAVARSLAPGALSRCTRTRLSRRKSSRSSPSTRVEAATWDQAVAYATRRGRGCDLQRRHPERAVRQTTAAVRGRWPTSSPIPPRIREITAKSRSRVPRPSYSATSPAPVPKRPIRYSRFCNRRPDKETNSATKSAWSSGGERLGNACRLFGRKEVGHLRNVLRRDERVAEWREVQVNAQTGADQPCWWTLRKP